MTLYKICYQCPDRKPGCHACCEGYKEARQAYEDKKEKIRAAKKIDSDIKSVQIRKW